MTTRILIFLLLLFPQLLLANSMVLPILRVVDGDTIETELNLPAPLNKVYIRMVGIDTPESNHLANCESERTQGVGAKIFLENYLKGEKTMVVTNFKWDKYGGRIDGVIFVNEVNINELMISKKYAMPYDGTGPKAEWCSIL
jgi:endonuclease YncB( thermonuclease family)